ncbi:MAG TPA: hypothetical protein VEH04_08470 [Verrucomicrobiae bacterium]|nr:hypothetical protein [Verrucomicrobiae bacterium]
MTRILHNARLAASSLILIAATSPVLAAQNAPATQGRRTDFSAFQIINNRNIFDPNRRAREQVRATPRPPQIVDTFSLVGTMSYSNQLLAFFDGSGSDYRKALRTGDRIATFTVTEIQQGTVKLESGTNDVSLRIGMQMRRMQDGSWNPAEPSYGTVSSYSGNRLRDVGDGRSFGSLRTGGPASSGGGSAAESSPAPDLSNLDPNDPVARLMLRRLQEEGGAPVRQASGLPQVPGGMMPPSELNPTQATPQDDTPAPGLAPAGERMLPNQETNEPEEASSQGGVGEPARAVNSQDGQFRN